MDWFFELASADELLALRPDMAKVKALGKRGVVATARAVEGAALSAPSFHVGADGAGSSTAPHFLSRFFAPQSGINEDPVTGSAHCALGPYWAEKLGTSQVVGFQASRRGGTVMVTVRAGRVALTGQAVTTLVGELRV
jgi:predicted PhzF superfamily epimerase YddE/YHI9